MKWKWVYEEECHTKYLRLMSDTECRTVSFSYSDAPRDALTVLLMAESHDSEALFPSKPNARLIEAVPDMLDALMLAREALSLAKHFMPLPLDVKLISSALRKTEAAINKAGR